jgi:hypothetical protein
VALDLQGELTKAWTALWLFLKVAILFALVILVTVISRAFYKSFLPASFIKRPGSRRIGPRTSISTDRLKKQES